MNQCLFSHNYCCSSSYEFQFPGSYVHVFFLISIEDQYSNMISRNERDPQKLMSNQELDQNVVVPEEEHGTLFKLYFSPQIQETFSTLKEGAQNLETSPLECLTHILSQNMSEVWTSAIVLPLIVCPQNLPHLPGQHLS